MIAEMKGCLRMYRCHFLRNWRPFDNPGSILKNTATASNKGVEVSLGYQGSVGGFRYSLNANVAHNTNKVISLGEGTAFQRGGVAGGNLATKTDKGHPIGSFYGYVVDHVAVDQADVNAHNAIAESTTGKTGTLFQADLIPETLSSRTSMGMVRSLQKIKPFWAARSQNGIMARMRTSVSKTLTLW